MAEEAMVPAAAEVAALRLAAEVAEAATAKGRRNETKLARAKRRRWSEAEGKMDFTASGAAYEQAFRKLMGV